MICFIRAASFSSEIQHLQQPGPRLKARGDEQPPGELHIDEPGEDADRVGDCSRLIMGYDVMSCDYYISLLEL